MWYVVQTTVGSEKQIAEKLNRVYSEHAENPCFVLLKERTWRREGIYQIGVEPMFPGYIFVDTEDPQRLEENVHRLAGKAQLLMDGQVFAIESSEEMLFKELSSRRFAAYSETISGTCKRGWRDCIGGRNFRRATGADCAKAIPQACCDSGNPIFGKNASGRIIDPGQG